MCVQWSYRYGWRNCTSKWIFIFMNQLNYEIQGNMYSVNIDEATVTFYGL